MYFVTFPVSGEPKTCFFEFLAKKTDPKKQGVIQSDKKSDQNINNLKKCSNFLQMVKSVDDLTDTSEVLGVAPSEIQSEIS